MLCLLLDALAVEEPHSIQVSAEHSDEGQVFVGHILCYQRPFKEGSRDVEQL